MGSGDRDPRQRRRDARRAQILAVAWDLARRDGIAAVSLRELAARVDLRQPSLYTYFASKAELYDAMFAEGFQALLDEREQLQLDPDPMVALRQGCRHFLDFCVADPARFELLFQRGAPGFHPSDASMKTSGAALGYLGRWLADAGLGAPEALDLMRALLMGLAGEQIANEPGGDRWLRMADDVVDVVAEVMRRRTPARRSLSRKERVGG